MKLIRHYRAQLKKESRINTPIQMDAQDSGQSNAIDLAYFKIGDFFSHHLHKYVDCILQRKLRWGLFVDLWELEVGTYQSMGNDRSKAVWEPIKVIHGQRKDWD